MPIVLYFRYGIRVHYTYRTSNVLNFDSKLITLSINSQDYMIGTTTFWVDLVYIIIIDFGNDAK